MDNLEALQKQLEIVFASYLQLSEDKQQTAMEMTLLVQRQMLRTHGRQRQMVVELGGTKGKPTSHVKKPCRKLAGESNDARQRAPRKPVQTRKKNDLRRT